MNQEFNHFQIFGDKRRIALYCKYKNNIPLLFPKKKAGALLWRPCGVY